MDSMSLDDVKDIVQDRLDKKKALMLDRLTNDKCKAVFILGAEIDEDKWFMRLLNQMSK